MAEPASYTAWNGETYQGAPPEGWHLGSDGRWWSPQAGPDPTPKKRNPVLAAIAIIFGLGLIAIVIAARKDIAASDENAVVRFDDEEIIDSYRMDVAAIWEPFTNVSDETIATNARNFCLVAEKSDDQQEFTTVLSKVWEDLEQDTQEALGGDTEIYLRLSSSALQYFCPETQQELQQAD